MEKIKVVYGEWNEEKSYQRTKSLLDRYKEANIIWAANDPMAFGALKAVKEKGLSSGKDILVGGLNWSIPAVNKVIEGEMVTTVGGHFMSGGWAMVMLYDYINGIDFAKGGNAQLKYDIFGVINKSNASNYLKHFKDENWSAIDFKKFTKKHNPGKKDYNFGLDPILEQFK